MFGGKKHIAVIGAGKIAHSLIPALCESGYAVHSITSLHKKSAERLAKKYSIPVFSDDYSDIPPRCKFYLLCIPDEDLKRTALKLSRLKRALEGSLFIHFSGAESSEVLGSLKKRGAEAASFHIMQTFPSFKPVKIKGCYAAIETDNESVFGFLKRFATDLRLKPFKMETKGKSLYHLSGVYASNFFSGNIFIAETLFKNAGIKDIDPVEVLMPIVNAALKNIKNLGPEKALSGPVERGDVLTIKKHLTELKDLAGGKNTSREKLILRNYIIQSLLLLEAVKLKYGELNDRHLKIRDLLNREIKKSGL